MHLGHHLNIWRSASFIQAGVFICFMHSLGLAHYDQADCVKRTSLFWILICIVCGGVTMRPFSMTSLNSLQSWTWTVTMEILPAHVLPTHHFGVILITKPLLSTVNRLLTLVSLFCIKHLSTTSLHKGKPPTQLRVCLSLTFKGIWRFLKDNMLKAGWLGEACSLCIYYCEKPAMPNAPL